MKYFAFTDTEEIVPLGEHDRMIKAMDAEPGNAVWVFSEDTLAALAEKIRKDTQMKLTLINGYPFPYPDNLTEEQQNELSENAGSVTLTLESVVHFEWLHTVTVEFASSEGRELAVKQTGWKRWGNSSLILEAPTSGPDGYGHPAIIVDNTAYCGFILENK